MAGPKVSGIKPLDLHFMDWEIGLFPVDNLFPPQQDGIGSVKTSVYRNQTGYWMYLFDHKKTDFVFIVKKKGGHYGKQHSHRQIEGKSSVSGLEQDLPDYI